MKENNQAVRKAEYQPLQVQDAKDELAASSMKESLKQAFGLTEATANVLMSAILPKEHQSLPNLVMALATYRSHGIDPMSRSIYMVPVRGALQPMINYAALQGICQRTGELRTCKTGVVYEGEKFTFNPIEGSITHELDFSKRGKSGKIVGAWCRVIRAKTAEEAVDPNNAYVAFAEWSRYQRSKGNDSAWDTNPEIMIAKTAKRMALKEAFAAETTGVYTRDEIESMSGNRVIDVRVQPTATRADTADALLDDVIDETPKPTDDPSGDAPTSHGDEAQAPQPEDKGAAAEQPIADTTRTVAAPESKPAKKKKATAAPPEAPADDLFANTTDPNNIKQTVANMHKALVDGYGKDELNDVLVDNFSDLMLDEQVEILEGAAKVLTMRHAGD